MMREALVALTGLGTLSVVWIAQGVDTMLEKDTLSFLLNQGLAVAMVMLGVWWLAFKAFPAFLAALKERDKDIQTNHERDWNRIAAELQKHDTNSVQCHEKILDELRRKAG